MFLIILNLLLYMFLIGDAKAQLDTPLKDPAFQAVWSHLDKKDIPKQYVINTFMNSEIKIHPKIISSFNNTIGLDLFFCSIFKMIIYKNYLIILLTLKPLHHIFCYFFYNRIRKIIIYLFMRANYI